MTDSELSDIERKARAMMEQRGWTMKAYGTTHEIWEHPSQGRIIHGIDSAFLCDFTLHVKGKSWGESNFLWFKTLTDAVSMAEEEERRALA